MKYPSQMKKKLYTNLEFTSILPNSPIIFATAKTERRLLSDTPQSLIVQLNASWGVTSVAILISLCRRLTHFLANNIQVKEIYIYMHSLEDMMEDEQLRRNEE